ncbi:DUF4122 family protein [Bacteroides uniformis]|uniref:DUF4122 family protein n=1 Tax=Bacteroides uniformis TaxID=820 RepID=UPI0039B3C1A0
METKIYLAVRIAVTIYLFYRLWIFLFSRGMYGLWGKLYDLARIARIRLWAYRKKRMAEQAGYARRKARWNKEVTAAAEMEPETRPESGQKNDVKPFLAEEEGNGVIGKSKFIYLEDPEVARNVPVRSEPLPASDFIGEEEDINPDEVEDNITPGKMGRNVLSEAETQELMAPVESEPDPDFSTALTFEQLGNVAEVLMSGSGDEGKVIWAAEILYQVKDTDLFNFFVNEVSTQEEIERLIGECLDEKGQPLPRRKRAQDKAVAGPIDWNEYM